MEPRIVAALAIIGACVIAAAIGVAVYLPRRRRQKLRRRGVKNHVTEPTIGRRIA